MLRILVLSICVIGFVQAEVQIINLGQGAQIQRIGSHMLRIVPNKSSNQVYYIRRDSLAMITDTTSDPLKGNVKVETRDKKVFVVPKKYIRLTKVLEVFDGQ